MDRIDDISESLGLLLPSPLTPLHDPVLHAHGVTLWLKRDDLIHPEIPGNKWRKLKYTLRSAAEEKASTLLTFGGAYSNHIRATAAAAYHFGFRSIGVIRGESHDPVNDVLRFATDRGMVLHYLDRESYREKRSRRIIEMLQRQYGSFFLVPEGGSSSLALPGCAELVAEIVEPFDYIICPVGTGGTLAGIASALTDKQQAIGVAALKGATFLEGDIRDLQMKYLGYSTDNWSVEHRFHFGGFAKVNHELREFVCELKRIHGLELDAIYVGKMMYALRSLVQEGAFAPGSRIVAVVTG